MTHRIVLTFGTRPEAIKMAPLFLALQDHPAFEPIILLTGQHREQLQQALDAFGLKGDRNLDVMTDRQTLPELAGKLIGPLAKAFTELGADSVLVHGDTLTTFVAAWSAFLIGLPVGHVEAGLRSGSLAEPFPEEANRLLTDRISTWLFAPTEGAKNNLLAEGFGGEQIIVTGQTGVDAVLIASKSGHWPTVVPKEDPIVTVTLHRRENWSLLSAMAKSLRAVAIKYKNHRFVCPLHLNPVVRDSLRPELEDLENVTLTEPLPYGEMARLMSESKLLITDSGGLQEEGASLGVPVAVVRNVTERPEGVGGALEIVGNDPEKLAHRLDALLQDQEKLARMAAAPNPYGDGRACARIVDFLAKKVRS